MSYPLLPKKISRKEGLELLKEHYSKIRDDLKRSTTLNYHELSDGRLLIEVLGGRHMMVSNSVKEYQDYLAWCYSQDNKHILDGCNFAPGSLAQDIADAAGAIAGQLGLPETILDKSFVSLKVIDAAIKKQRVPEDRFMEKLYKHMILYVGESIIKEKGGEWVLRPYDKKIYEPFVQLANGKLIKNFVDIWDEANERMKSFSSYDCAMLSI